MAHTQGAWYSSPYRDPVVPNLRFGTTGPDVLAPVNNSVSFFTVPEKVS